MILHEAVIVKLQEALPLGNRTKKIRIAALRRKLGQR